MNAKRLVLLAAALLAIACAAYARPRLAILPFTGGGGADGDTIALLLDNQPDMARVFTVVPRAGGVDAIVREHRFQRSGLTDSDTIAELGRQMNVDYVVAGHIQQLGARRPGLAVLPFYVMSGAVNEGDAEVLAQLLATEIANSGCTRYCRAPARWKG